MTQPPESRRGAADDNPDSPRWRGAPSLRSVEGDGPAEEAAAARPRRGAAARPDAQSQDPEARPERRNPRPDAARPDAPRPETPRPAPARQPKTVAAPTRFRPPARKAGLARRHVLVAFSFLLLVVAPAVLSGLYLWTRAQDQYASYGGFSVRSESGPQPTDLLGGLIGMSSNSTSDTEILYKYINSRELVSRIDAQLDLRAIWSKAPNDPVFNYRGSGSVEDLLENWQRKVKVFIDDGMIDIRVLAFEPQDAQAIGRAIFAASSDKINELNDVARGDSIRYARADLDEAVERLKDARQAMTAFRNRHQIVDPSVDVQGQAGVLTSLQQQLADALIQQGLLRSNQVQEGDARLEQAGKRVAVIEQQIDEQRRKFGSETSEGEQLSEVVGQYEGLAVDRQFAETAYIAALAAYDTARAEAERKTRYLGAYQEPTLAQGPEYPERFGWLVLIGVGLLLVWMIGVLIYYSLRDRR